MGRPKNNRIVTINEKKYYFDKQKFSCIISDYSKEKKMKIGDVDVELARVLSVSDETIRKWKRPNDDTTYPLEEHLEDITMFFGVNKVDLLKTIEHDSDETLITENDNILISKLDVNKYKEYISDGQLVSFIFYDIISIFYERYKCFAQRTQFQRYHQNRYKFLDYLNTSYIEDLKKIIVEVNKKYLGVSDETLSKVMRLLYETISFLDGGNTYDSYCIADFDWRMLIMFDNDNNREEAINDDNYLELEEEYLLYLGLIDQIEDNWIVYLEDGTVSSDAIEKYKDICEIYHIEPIDVYLYSVKKEFTSLFKTEFKNLAY